MSTLKFNSIKLHLTVIIVGGFVGLIIDSLIAGQLYVGASTMLGAFAGETIGLIYIQLSSNFDLDTGDDK